MSSKKKKPNKPKKKPPQSWSMFPALHEKVSQAIEDDLLLVTFHGVDDASGCVNEFYTNIMGRFICHNRGCDLSGWSSKKIAVTIRMYPNDRYNARVYHQRCRGCDRLSRPKLDGSYADRIAYRLKKWSGVEMELPPYNGESRGPHHSNLCEGCRNGHCSELGRSEFE